MYELPTILEPRGVTTRNFSTWRAARQVWEYGYNFLGAKGPAPQQLGRSKNIQTSTQFRTTSDFDREYLRNALRYRQAEKGVINHDPPRIRQKDLVNLVH